jgi:hypothetical protein
MRKIFTRSPFYLSVKEEYIEPEIIIPEEGDPDPEPVEDPTDPNNDPPTQSTQNLTYSCGTTVNQNGFVGTSIYKKYYDFFLADLSTAYSVSGTPAKFTFTWDSTTVTTGYIGSDVYDDELVAAGVDAGEINTTTTNNAVTGTIEISKTAQAPTDIFLTVHTPLLNSNISMTNTCEIIPEVVPTNTVYVCYIQSKPNSLAGAGMQETITFNGTPLQGKAYPSISDPVENVVVNTLKNSMETTYLTFGNLDGYTNPPGAELPQNPNFDNKDYIKAGTYSAVDLNIYLCDINQLKLNAMNVFRMSNSYGNLLKQYDIRWYKGEILWTAFNTAYVGNVCLVNDVSKDFGFATGTLTYTDVYPVITENCK